MALNFIENILGLEDDNFLVDYNLSVINEELHIEILQINHERIGDSKATLNDLQCIYDWIHDNHSVAEIKCDSHAQRYESL